MKLCRCLLELFYRRFVIRKGVDLPTELGWLGSRCSIKSRFDCCHGVHHRTVIHMQIKVGGCGDLSMTENVLNHFHVSGHVEHPLGQSMPEHMGVDAAPDFPADIAERRFEGEIRQWCALSSAQRYPQSGHAITSFSLLAQIASKQRPEVVGYRHTVFVTG